MLLESIPAKARKEADYYKPSTAELFEVPLATDFETSDSTLKPDEPQATRGVTVPTSLTFEHPLNERVRIFLRLEYLLEKVAHFLSREDPWMSRAAIEGLVGILTIAARVDIKTELLKELARNSNALSRIRSGPEVDSQILEKRLDDIRQAASDLHQLSGQIGEALRRDDFFKDIVQRSNLPGGICSFDLPQYHYWLEQPSDLRQQRLHTWNRSLQPVSNAVALTLSLVRTSTEPHEVTAVGGFYQQALVLRTPAQLVRVVPDGSDLFPVISSYKNRFSIRFMSMQETGRPTPWPTDTDFSLTCCTF